jgi:acyl carrier protein
VIFTTADVRTRIAGLIHATLHFDVPGPETDLIATGLFDSMALVSLIVELECEFGCEIPLEALDLECFRSIDRMARFMVSALDGFAPSSAVVIDGHDPDIDP